MFTEEEKELVLNVLTYEKKYLDQKKDENTRSDYMMIKHLITKITHFFDGSLYENEIKFLNPLVAKQKEMLESVKRVDLEDYINQLANLQKKLTV